MVYLIVGLDRDTLAPWHQHVAARSVTSASRLARARARNHGIDLVIAAVVGPASDVIAEAAGA
jgi:hypothetical protein